MSDRTGDSPQFRRSWADLSRLQESSAPSSTPPQHLPVSLGLSEFHALLLYPSALVAVNRVDERVVQVLPLQPAPSGPAAAALASSYLSYSTLQGRPLTLLRDPLSRTTYLVTTEALYEVLIRREARDMWRVLIGRRDFAGALKYCETVSQRDQVFVEEARAAIRVGDWNHAASCYARLALGTPSFEQTALLFMEAKQDEALQVYLTHVLRRAPPDAHVARSVLCTWVTETLLRRLAAAGEGTEAHRSIARELQQFLSKARPRQQPSGGCLCIISLPVAPVQEMRHAPEETAVTVASLLRMAGRLVDLETLEAARGNHRAVLLLMAQTSDVGALGGDDLWSHALLDTQHFPRQPPQWTRMLKYLRRPQVPKELHYELAAQLMLAFPADVVELWVGLGSALEPRRLLPGLVAGMEAPAGRAAALRYLDYCFRHLRATDQALHNLAVTLHAKYPPRQGDAGGEEAALLVYLAAAKGARGQPLYDPGYAVRLCQECGRKRAVIYLSQEMGMLQEAVEARRSALLSCADVGTGRCRRRSPSTLHCSSRSRWTGQRLWTLPSGQPRTTSLSTRTSGAPLPGRPCTRARGGRGSCRLPWGFLGSPGGHCESRTSWTLSPISPGASDTPALQAVDAGWLSAAPRHHASVLAVNALPQPQKRKLALLMLLLLGRIDEVRDVLLGALGDYHELAGTLQTEMGGWARQAESLRKDLEAVGERSAVITDPMQTCCQLCQGKCKHRVSLHGTRPDSFDDVGCRLASPLLLPAGALGSAPRAKFTRKAAAAIYAAGAASSGASAASLHPAPERLTSQRENTAVDARAAGTVRHLWDICIELSS